MARSRRAAHPSSPARSSSARIESVSTPFSVTTRWAYAATAAVALLQFAPSLSKMTSHYLGSASCDMDRAYRHFVEFAVASLTSGEVPQWNPFIFCGTPFLLGTSATLLHPLNLPILLALPQPLSVNVCLVVHVLLFGLFTVLFARTRGSSPLGAAFSGILAATGSVIFTRVYAGHFTFVCTAAWIPLVFWAQEKVFRDGLSKAWLLGGASALLFSGGHVQLAYYAALLLGLSLGVRTLLEAGPGAAGRFARHAGAHACAGLIALLLCAAEVLPMLDAVRFSARRAVTEPGWLRLFSMPPESLASLVAPGILGQGHEYFGRWFWWETCWYTGVPGLVLGVLGAARRFPSRHRDSLPWLAAAALVLSLIAYIPVASSAAAAIPGWSLFRGHAKIGVFLVFALAVFAGHGFDAIRSGRGRASSLTILGFVLVGASSAVAAALATPELFHRYLAAPGLLAERSPYLPFGDPRALPALATQGAVRARDALLAATALAAAFAVLIALRSRVRPPFWTIAFFALTLLDLARVAVPTSNERFPGRSHRLPERAETFFRERAASARFEIAGSGLVNAGMSMRAAGVGGNDVTVPRFYNTFLSACLRRPLETPILDVALTRDDPLFDAANLVYFAFEPVSRLQTADTLLAAGRFDGLEVRSRPSALPRAWIVGAARWVPDDEAQIRAELRAGVDFRTEVLLVGPPVSQPGERFPAVEVPVSYVGCRRAEMRATREGWLVLADTYYPHWRVTVAGRDARLYRANGAFRAVRVSAGDDVVFTYSNPAFFTGAVISLVSLGTALLLAARRLRKSR